MKIGLICPYNIFNGGGVQEIVKALHEDYVKRGLEAKIITPLPREYSGKVPDHIITLGISMSTTAFAGTAWQWSVSVDTDAIDDVFEREKFDVLHFHEPWIPVWGRQLLMRSNTANVATMHGRFMDTITAKTLTTVVIPYARPMIKHFDAFTAVSESPTDLLNLIRKVPITIVPNGIDLSKYGHQPEGVVKHDDQKVILFIGRLEDRKGVKFLLKAFEEIAPKHPELHLLIAGDGPDRQKLRRYVSGHHIPRVSFLGFISEEEKVRQLYQADVFCSPAYYGESFGIVLLEAMATGIPTVAGDNPGYQSVLVDRGALSLVNSQDIVDFARRLELMLYDDQLRKLWKDWAKGYVKQFDYPKVTEQYLKVYEQAIRHHRQPQRRLT